MNYTRKKLKDGRQGAGMAGHKVGYIRVSSVVQNAERQLEGMGKIPWNLLIAYGCWLSVPEQPCKSSSMSCDCIEREPDFLCKIEMKKNITRCGLGRCQYERNLSVCNNRHHLV